MKRFRVRISRTPRSGAEPTGCFELDFDESRTLLDLLGAIERGHDRDLVYRHSCHHGSCGTCAIRVNGRELLACTTTLDSIDTADLLFEPLTGFPVRADLAIDPALLFAGIPERTSHLRPVEPRGGRVPAELSSFSRFENCIECGACLSACPVGEGFVGPAALAAVATELAKSPGRRSELLSIAGRPNGVDGCIEAFECSRVCPAAVYPSRKIIDLKNMLAGR